MVSLLDKTPEDSNEVYFKEVRPKLYEEHGDRAQYGSRKGRSLAEHLDSACQFVLTVSKVAGVPEEKRALILAATAVHDLNKLDDRHRNVKTLARDLEFLQQQLERAPGTVSAMAPGFCRKIPRSNAGQPCSSAAIYSISALRKRNECARWKPS